MTLEFRPPPYIQTQPTGYQRGQQISDSLNNLGDTFLNLAKTKMEKKRQDLLNQFLGGQIKAQQAEYAPLIPPGMGSGPAPTPSTGDSSGSFNGLTGGSLAPTIQPSPGSQFPSAPPSGNQTTGMPASTVQAWNSLPPNHPFGPQGQQPSTMFQNAGASSDPEAPLRRILMDPNTSPALANRVAQRLKMITEEEKTPFEKQGWQTGLDVQRSEAAKNYAEARANGGISPQDLQDINNGNYANIATRYGGTIPKHIADMVQTGQQRQNQLENDAIQTANRIINSRSGDFGIQNQKVSQAIHLKNLINQYKSVDPQTGQVTYHVPNALYGELSLGMANLLSPTGQATDSARQAIQQKTAQGSLNELLTYAGLPPTTLSGSTDSVIKNLEDSIDRQGSTAEQLREPVLNQIRNEMPSMLRPDAKERIINNLGVNSYRSYAKNGGFVGKKYGSLADTPNPATPAPSSTTQPRYQKNIKTGQTRVSYDGGQTWQLQQ